MNPKNHTNMKKHLFTLTLALLLCQLLQAQIVKSGNITSSETWTSNNIYILNGWVYVKAGATLTIQPGTIIKGDFATQGALIIERDAKIIADGTAEMPIVFTSQKSPGLRNYGDWGGLIICGRAGVNQPANATLGTQQGEAVIEGGVGSFYGGGPNPDNDDSSGVLRHVRIEFPGIAFQPNSEINGLTCGGVGRKTVIEHVQVSYSGDDSFEFFGGTVNCKWLIAYKGWDDEFDTDFGYQGKIQFAVSLRDPTIADQSGSNGFESDNDGTGTTNTPITSPVFSNVSIFGPYCFSSSVAGNYKRALHLRRNTRTSAFNSVFAGYPTGLLIESTSTQSNATNGDLRFKNCRIVQMNDSLAATTAANPNENNGGFNIYNFFNGAGNNNQLIGTAASLMVTDLNIGTPELSLQATSPLITGASFTDTYLSDPFFTPVSYIGAFGQDDWTDCWAEWDPQNQPYNTSINNAFTVTATAQGSTTFCAGGSVTLDAGSYPGASFLWSNGATTQTTTITTSGTYSVSVTKSNGCVATSNSIAVNVLSNPAVPVITPNGLTTFCNGGSVDLASSVTSNILWSNNSTSSTITVNSSGTYDVTVTDANGCSSTSASTTVTVNPNPAAPLITASGPTSFCTGDSVILSSSETTGNTWTPGNETSQNITVYNSGTFVVTYTDANGCDASSTPVTVSESAAPAPTVSIAGSTSLCPGETVTLTSSIADTYLWSPGGQTTQSILVSAAGTYFVTATNSDACDGTGPSSSVTINVLTGPTAGFTTSVPVVNQYQFTNTSGGGTVYSWDFGDLSSSTASNPTHVYTGSGTYSVVLVVTDANGCTDTATLVLSVGVGVDEQKALMNGITLYPNPSNEFVNIEISMNETVSGSVMIFDLAGQVLLQEKRTMTAGINTLAYDLSGWSAGIYFVRISSGDSGYTTRMVISR